MTYKMGAKGQVVIPKPIRDRLHLKPGDELLVGEEEGEVRISKAGSARSLLGILAGGPSLTAALEGDRRSEREHEERKYREWSAGRRS
jgi:AbrB family looped-hinge helix DNA binding protein